jgi:hypothetical protein
VNSTNDHSHRLDPTEQYTNDRFQEMNNGSDKSRNIDLIQIFLKIFFIYL